MPQAHAGCVAKRLMSEEATATRARTGRRMREV
jgi:hypothetical protein